MFNVTNFYMNDRKTANSLPETLFLTFLKRGLESISLYYSILFKIVTLVAISMFEWKT